MAALPAAAESSGSYHTGSVRAVCGEAACAGGACRMVRVAAVAAAASGGGGGGSGGGGSDGGGSGIQRRRVDIWPTRRVTLTKARGISGQ